MFEAGRSTAQVEESPGAAFHPEQHTQWYSPLESSLAGRSPRRTPSSAAESNGRLEGVGYGVHPYPSPSMEGTPRSAAPGAAGSGTSGVAERPFPVAAAPDWLVRGPAPLIDLLSWHEPEPGSGPLASAPMPSAAEPSSVLYAVPAHGNLLEASGTGTGRETLGAAAAGRQPVMQAGPAQAQQPAAATFSPGWEAFSEEGVRLCGGGSAGGGGGGAHAGGAIAPAVKAAPVQPSPWGGEEGVGKPFSGSAPGGAAWAHSGSRKAAVAALDKRPGEGSRARMGAHRRCSASPPLVTLAEPSASAPTALDGRHGESSPAGVSAQHTQGASSPVVTLAAPSAPPAPAGLLLGPHDAAEQLGGRRPAQGMDRRPREASAAGPLRAKTLEADLQHVRNQLRSGSRTFLVLDVDWFAYAPGRDDKLSHSLPPCCAALACKDVSRE